MAWSCGPSDGFQIKQGLEKIAEAIETLSKALFSLKKGEMDNADCQEADTTEET